MCLLLADLPVIKFSGACKIFVTTRTLDGNEMLPGTIQMQFSLPPPRKRKAFGNLVYIIYAV